MATAPAEDQSPRTVTMWLDPVCPFSWNTARWLASAADAAGVIIDLRMMSLAVLNEGRELPAPQQSRMNDSRRVGRLMTAISDELGTGALRTAYFAFARQHFDHSTEVSERLANHVVHAVGAQHTTAAALDDASLDSAVAKSHQASQNALGDAGGSPLLTIDGRTVFGPVLTAVPDAGDAPALFDAVSALIRAPEFSQLNRPRTHA